MAIPCSTKDLENKKFVECPEGQPSVSVKVCNPSEFPGGNAGRTVSLPGVANATVALVPAVPVAGEIILGVGIWNDSPGRTILISFDNGATFHEHRSLEFLSQEVRGSITQLHIKTAAGNSPYRLVVNFGVG